MAASYETTADDGGPLADRLDSQENATSTASGSKSVTPSNGWTVEGPEGAVGRLRKNRAVLETVRAVVAAGAAPEGLVGLLGASHLRAVEGTLTGARLWHAFSQVHGKKEKHRSLWFLDDPIHHDGSTWVLANNVWGPRTYEVFRALVSVCGRAVTVIQPNGFKVRPFETGEGMRVLKPGESLPPKQKLSKRPSEQNPIPESHHPVGDAFRQAAAHASTWSVSEQAILERLAAAEPRWRQVGPPADGFGPRTLQIAADIHEHGLLVAPLTNPADTAALLDHELAPAQLLATKGSRQFAAFTDDYDQDEDPARWARLKARIGPYRESSVLDRELADFSVHGPFERAVTRRNGQVWVIVSVRLADVGTALLDLINVADSLHTALSTADQT